MEDKTISEINSRFSYHNADAQGVDKMEKVRTKCRELALLIHELAPDSREKSTAFTQLQFVMMSANSAIVQQYPIKS